MKSCLDESSLLDLIEVSEVDESYEGKMISSSIRQQEDRFTSFLIETALSCPFAVITLIKNTSLVEIFNGVFVPSNDEGSTFRSSGNLAKVSK